MTILNLIQDTAKFAPLCRVVIASMLFVMGIASGGCAGQKAQAIEQQREVVVVLHGLGRSKSAMWLLARRLEDAGFETYRVGYSSLGVTPEQILEQVSHQIQACCTTETRPVHYVGHSLGGLLIRAYLDQHHPSPLGRVVLIGTPNHGTPLVDYFYDQWWMRLLGPTALALGTDADSFPNRLGPPYYPVGIIAGKSGGHGNDTVLPGIDDGIVPVDSTKLAQMSDFILVDSSHAFMRYNEVVAQEVIQFLRNGKFEHHRTTNR